MGVAKGKGLVVVVLIRGLMVTVKQEGKCLCSGCITECDSLGSF